MKNKIFFQIYKIFFCKKLNKIYSKSRKFFPFLIKTGKNFFLFRKFKLNRAYFFRNYKIIFYKKKKYFKLRFFNNKKKFFIIKKFKILNSINILKSKNQIFNTIKSNINLSAFNATKPLSFKLLQQLKNPLFYYSPIIRINTYKTLFWQHDLIALFLINNTQKSKQLQKYNQILQKFISYYVTWTYTQFKYTPLQLFSKSNFTLNKFKKLIKKTAWLNKFVIFKKFNYLFFLKYNLKKKRFKNLNRFLKQKWKKEFKQFLKKQYTLNRFAKTYLNLIFYRYFITLKLYLFHYKHFKFKNQFNSLNFQYNTNRKYLRLEKLIPSLKIQKSFKYSFFALKTILVNKKLNRNLKICKKNQLFYLFNQQLKFYNCFYNKKINKLLPIKNKYFIFYNLLKYNFLIKTDQFFSINHFMEKKNQLEKKKIRKMIFKKFRSSRIYRKFKRYSQILINKRKKLNTLQFIKKWQRLSNQYSLFKYFKKYYFFKTFSGWKPWEIKKILKFFKHYTSKTLFFLKKKLNQKLIFKLINLKLLGNFYLVKQFLKKKLIVIDSFPVTNRFITVNSTNLISFNLPYITTLYQYSINLNNNYIKYNFINFFNKYDIIQLLYLNNNKNIQQSIKKQYKIKCNILNRSIKKKRNYYLNFKPFFNKKNKNNFFKKYSLLRLKAKTYILNKLNKIIIKQKINKIRKLQFLPTNSIKLVKPFITNKIPLSLIGSFFKNYWKIQYFLYWINNHTLNTNIQIINYNIYKFSKQINLTQLNYNKNLLNSSLLTQNLPQIYTFNTFDTFNKNIIYPTKFRKIKRKNKKFLRKFLTHSTITNKKNFRNSIYRLNKRNWHDNLSLKIAITKY